MFNRTLIFAAVVLSSAAGGFIAQQVPNAFAQPGVVVGHIDAESITLRNQARTRSINLQVTDDHAFMFINGLDGRVISIGDMGNGPRGFACVGIYASKKSQAKGFSVALAANSKDGGFVQFIDEKTGKTTFQEKAGEFCECCDCDKCDCCNAAAPKIGSCWTIGRGFFGW